jgi:hypothetical protein
MTIIGVGLGPGQPHKFPFKEVSSVVVERKSMAPSVTVMVLAIIVLLITKYNLLWFIINLDKTEGFTTPVALGIAILCAILTALRSMFVNVSVRSRDRSLTVRLVPIRSAKRLAQRFSEMSGEG